MTKILYIAASPRGAMSQSGKLAEAYLAARQVLIKGAKPLEAMARIKTRRRQR